MENIVIDAGPLIALFNKRDAFHDKAVAFLRTHNFQYFTTWPVITEACHMLDYRVQAQLNLLTWLQRGGVQLVDLSNDLLVRLVYLINKFSDVPMDLADAPA